jgi:hypothetical protein
MGSNDLYLPSRESTGKELISQEKKSNAGSTILLQMLETIVVGKRMIFPVSPD